MHRGPNLLSRAPRVPPFAAISVTALALLAELAHATSHLCTATGATSICTPGHYGCCDGTNSFCASISHSRYPDPSTLVPLGVSTDAADLAWGKACLECPSGRYSQVYSRGVATAHGINYGRDRCYPSNGPVAPADSSAWRWI